MLYAYPWCEGESTSKFDGDSSLYPSLEDTVEYDGESFEQLRVEWIAKWVEDSGCDLDEVEEEFADIAGFWIFDDAGWAIVEASQPEWCGNDSACYAANAATKRVLNAVAKKEVPKEDGY